MTRYRQHAAWQWSYPLLLTLFAWLSAGSAEAAPPVWEGWIVPNGAISGCQDIWVIDARSTPCRGDLYGGMSNLRFYHSENLGVLQRWEEYSQTEFLMMADASLPTTYFFHGYGMGRSGAVISAERLGESVGADAPPFRLVIWAWPARHRVLASLDRNIAEKTAAASAQGYYLASLVRQMQPDAAVTLAGHSFGSRSVLSALQAMAVGHYSGVPLPPDASPDRPVQVTLLAPAVPSDSLADEGEFFLATSEADRMLITINEDDISLNLMARISRSRRILGLTGPTEVPAGSEVYLLNAKPYVGRGHRVARFAWSGPVANSLQPFLINYAAENR